MIASCPKLLETGELGNVRSNRALKSVEANGDGLKTRDCEQLIGDFTWREAVAGNVQLEYIEVGEIGC